MRRHKRRPELFPIECERFVGQASRYHDELSAYLQALKPNSPHYKALLNLHQAVCQATRDVSGDERLPWGSANTAAHLGGAPKKDD